MTFQVLLVSHRVPQAPVVDQGLLTLLQGSSPEICCSCCGFFPSSVASPGSRERPRLQSFGKERLVDQPFMLQALASYKEPRPVHKTVAKQQAPKPVSEGL